MVHAAQIYSCRVPSEPWGDEVVQLAVDVFWVHHRQGLDAVVAALGNLGRRLDSVIAGEQTAGALVASHPTRQGTQRGQPPVADRVIIDQRAAPDHTVVEVLTRDRPGLLFALSDPIHRQGLSIAVAKISTEGTRVVDVFYVSEPDGKKVTIEQHVEALERALLDAIDGLDRAS
jgi:[protein-PII] uridylyltransferase